MVKRFDDWPNRLSNYLDQKRMVPFQWGVNDCMTFAAGAVFNLTGKDFYIGYDPYDDEIGAFVMLREHGGVTGIINKHLGRGSKEIMLAKRGDVVTVKIPELAAGIVDDTGQRIAVVTPNGLLRLPLSRAVRLWSY